MRGSGRVLSGVYKRVLALCAAIGLFWQMGLFTAAPRWGALRYYTVLVNLLCLVYFTVDEYWVLLRGRSWWPLIKGGLTMAAAAAGLVAYFVLGQSPLALLRAKVAAALLLYYAVPLLTVLDWLLFDRKGSFRPTDPLTWAVFPNAYFLYATVRGFLLSPVFDGRRFPYAFMDYDALGVGPVLLRWLVFNLAFLCLGYVLWLVDRFASGKR